MSLNCLICNCDFEFDSEQECQNEIAELLSELFRVFSQYMRWDPPSSFQFDFLLDNFPFCKTCKLIPVSVFRLHEQVLMLQNQIGQICSSVNAKVLLSEEEGSGGRSVHRLLSGDKAILSTVNTNEPTWKDKVKYHRSIVCNEYMAWIGLPHLDIRSFMLRNPSEALLADRDEVQETGGENSSSAYENDSEDDFKFDNDSGRDKDDPSENLDPGRGFDKNDKSSASAGVKQLPESPPEPDEISKSMQLILARVKNKVHPLVSSGQCKQVGENKFKCPRCPFTGSAFSIRSHLKSFHNPGLACKRKYTVTELGSNRFLLNDEYEVNYVDNHFKCKLCGEASQARNQLIRHILNKHAPARATSLQVEKIGTSKLLIGGKFYCEIIENGLKCCECSYSTPPKKSKYKMLQHMRRVHLKLSRKHVCEVCGFNTFDSHNFKKHQLIHRTDQSFVCSRCGVKLKSILSLKSHERKMHADELEDVPMFLCEVCGEKFGGQCFLNMHMERRHKIVSCQVCKKKYNPITIKNHMLSHSTENSFKCWQCGKAFRRATSLYMHRKSCKGDKPFSCDVCGMKFTQPYSVTRHKKVVHSSYKKTKSYKRPKKNDTTKQTTSAPN